MHRSDARKKRRATCRIEHGVRGGDHPVGQFLRCVPLSTLCVGDLRDVVFRPAEHLGIVGPLDEVCNLGSQACGANRREVCAATEFTQNRRQLHRATGHVGHQGFALHRRVETETIGVGSRIHGIGCRNECIEAGNTGELRPTKIGTAFQVRATRRARRTLRLCRFPCATDDGRIEIAEVRRQRRTVAVAQRTTTAEHVELHSVQTQLLANFTRLGSEVEAVTGVTDEWTRICKELGKGRFDGHDPRIVRPFGTFVGQTGDVSPTNLLGLVASTLSMLFIWPQVFRVYRNNTVEGLAPLGAIQGMSGSMLWSIYGLSQSDMPLFGSNLLLSVAIALLGVAMMRHGVLSRGTLLGVVVGVLGMGVAATVISTSLVGVLAFAIGASSVLPQTFKVLRDPDLDGVSVSSNSLLFVTSSAWLTYGLAISDTLVWLPNLLVIPCSALIVAKARASQRRTANVPAHAA